MKGLRGVKSDALVLSIIAGASMKKIGTGLKHKAVVRSMPNTPGQIGEGITVWTASKEVTEEQHEITRGILGALGEEVFVEDESYLDMATALSGTGPAYVFLFADQAYLRRALPQDPYPRDTPTGLGAGLSFRTGAGQFQFVYALGRSQQQRLSLSAGKIHFGITSRF